MVFHIFRIWLEMVSAGSAVVREHLVGVWLSGFIFFSI